MRAREEGTVTERSGSIVGGFVLAAEEIVARNIGSPSASATKVVAGVDLARVKRESDLQQQIEIDNILMAQILRSLNLDSPDMERIKQLVLRSSEAERKRIAGSVRKLLELLKRHEAAVAERETLNLKLQEMALRGGVSASGTVYSGTILRIGDQTQTLREDAPRVRFSLIERDDDIQLQTTPI